MALVEAIGGRARAEAVAATLGVETWGPEHNSEQFRLTAGGFLTSLRNKVVFWGHEELGLSVAPGADEIRIALIADAYGRTRRSTAWTVAESPEPIRTRRGLLLLPERVSATADAPDRMLPLMEDLPPVQTLDRSLEAIASRYGQSTADFVALTMEYAWGRWSSAAAGGRRPEPPFLLTLSRGRGTGARRIGPWSPRPPRMPRA